MKAESATFAMVGALVLAWLGCLCWCIGPECQKLLLGLAALTVAWCAVVLLIA